LKRVLFIVLFITLVTSITVYAKDEILFVEEPFKDGQTYTSVWPFYEGLAVARKGDFFTGKWGYINEKGEEVIPCIYDLAYHFSDGLAPVKRGGKMGFINKKGEVVIPFIYNAVSEFSEGMAAVANEKYIYGYVDKTGKQVIPFQYTEAGVFSEGLAHVHGDYFNTPNGRGHIDKTGKIITPLEHEEVGPFKEGLAFYRKDYKYGFINKEDEIVITAKYDRIHDFKDGMAAVCFEGKWGYIDTKGNTVIPFEYDYISGFSDGLSAVYKDEKWGFIDEKGKIVIPIIYDEAGGFNEGLCVVAKKDENGNPKWGYIDKTGKELTPFIYHTATVVRNGVAAVNNSNILKVSKSGTTPTKELTPAKPKEIIATPNKLKVMINGSEIGIGSYLIDNTSYFKLRDIAYALKATPKYFDVYWSDYSKSIFLSSGRDYVPVGGEMTEIKNSKVSAIPSKSKLFINDKQQYLECYTIEGNNYFKLRDLGKYLMFDVGYNDEKRQIEIGTSKKLGVSIGEINVRLGDSLNSVVQKLGNPDRIDDKVTNLKWYVYNNDYSKFIMVGFLNDKVASIYTSHTEFVVDDTIKYGEFEENLPSSQNFKYYIDEFGGKILYGIMIQEDPSIGLWKKEAAKKDILPIYEFQEFDCLNAFRVNSGLGALKLDEIALKTAREHSKDMAENDYLEHTGLDGRAHYNRYWDNNGKNQPFAENIAGGDNNGLDQFKGFLNSYGHRMNMINPDADYVGIGVYYYEESTYKYYGTQAITRKKQ